MFLAVLGNFAVGCFAFYRLNTFLISLCGRVAVHSRVSFVYLNWFAWGQLVGLIMVLFTFHFEFKVV